jgi:hypothetical protein
MNKKGRAKGCTAQRKEGSYANARLLLSQALPIEQVLLTLNAPRVTRGRSVKAYYAVTGYCDRQVILGARTRYRPNRLRPSDTLRDFGKRNRLAYRNLPQSSPHPLLEGCAADIERQVQADFRVLNAGFNSSGRFCEKSTDLPGMMPSQYHAHGNLLSGGGSVVLRR